MNNEVFHEIINMCLTPDNMEVGLDILNKNYVQNQDFSTNKLYLALDMMVHNKLLLSKPISSYGRSFCRNEDKNNPYPNHIFFANNNISFIDLHNNVNYIIIDEPKFSKNKIIVEYLKDEDSDYIVYFKIKKKSFIMDMINNKIVEIKTKPDFL